MILAVKWAREQKIPFLGICLGFQVAVMEWARNVLGIESEWSSYFSREKISYKNFIRLFAGANSGEFQPEDDNSVVIFMPEGSRTHMGGTMRLGLRPTVFVDSPPSTPVPTPDASSSSNAPNTSSHPNHPAYSKVRALYGNAPKVWERHRHRYEVNPTYVPRFEASGMRFVGKDERGERMQIMELASHPFFVGLQAHPEFCSRPLNPSPPFLGFVAASCGSVELNEQCEAQEQSYVPPHPKGSMVDEESIVRSQREGGGSVKDAGSGTKEGGDVKMNGSAT
jgi:CTP synthase